MTKTKLTIAVGTLALGLAALNPPSQAQGPLYDQVNVSLPYTITIGDRTLQPGDYVIRQMPSASNSRVLLISSDNGMKFETSALTIPALDNRTPEDTKVVLHHFGSDYYFDKIWIQGKNYGYEFPIPDSVKARQREAAEPVSVAGRYESMPGESSSQTTAEAQPAPATAPAEPAPAQEPVTTAQAQRAPEPTPAPMAEPTPALAEPAPAQVTEPTPMPTPEATQPAETASAQPAPTMTGSADRAMPDTAANWLTMLLGGGLLSGAGLLLRRKQ